MKKKQKMLTSSEIASFCDQTALLIQSGILPVECMDILLSDTHTKEGKEILQTVRDVCGVGEPFSEGLARTGVFPDYCLHLISLGEESGNLDTCLRSLSEYYTKDDNIRSGIRSAVSYPLIMIGMMFAVIYVLVSRVLPIFNQVFSELGSEISGFAASLMSIGSTLNRYSYVLLILIGGAILFYFASLKIPFFKNACRRFLNWLPLTRDFNEKYACQRFASGMAMTMSSGIDTYSSLDMAANLVDNPKMQERIKSCKDQIKAGSTLPEALAGAHIFSNLHSRMIAIGFRSGNIDAVMQGIADSYEQETDKKIQSIIAVLEPTLVIILSIIVGMILLSFILPLMGIMSSIG